MSAIRRERRPFARVLIAAGIIGAALVHAPSPAGAHALLLESTPTHDERGTSPAQLVLRFNGRIEKRLSRVTLVGGPGTTPITLDRPTASRADTLVYPLPGLAPGPWEARWWVLSVDGHFTEGRVRFTVENP